MKPNGETNWFEIEEIVKRDALKREDFYNDNLSRKIFQTISKVLQRWSLLGCNRSTQNKWQVLSIQINVL